MVECKLTESKCYIPLEVISEIVYVLAKTYGISRRKTSFSILCFLRIDSVCCANMEIAEIALDVYTYTNLDFVDCILVGYSAQGHDIFTFDKKLKKQIEKRQS
jgi:predicted nucleic-acid-binding protein